MIIMKIIIFCFLFAGWAKMATAKINFIHDNHFAANLKFIGLTYHPGGGEGDYPLSFDKEGFLVLQTGLEADGDYYLNPYILIRTSTSLYLDCALLWSGFFHVGPRLNLPLGERLEFRIGIGPTLIWRQNWWGEVDWYNGDLFYGKEENNKAIQTAYLWYGGNIEIEYKLNESFSLAYSVVPGYPQVFTNSFGARKHF